MHRYYNREEAGKVLAEHLQDYTDREDVLVFALPRGGVPVGYEIAKKIHAPLDVFIVRKLGVPGHDELAMGAIAMGGVEIFNQDIINHLRISQSQIQAVIERETQEMKRREIAYRGNKPFPQIKNKIIILVDDGIATGATMRAAIASLRKMEPSQLIVAVPVAATDMSREMESLVDEFVCPMQVRDFYAVGAWYEHFDQTTDEEVHELLRS